MPGALQKVREAEFQFPPLDKSRSAPLYPGRFPYADIESRFFVKFKGTSAQLSPGCNLRAPQLLFFC